MPVGTIDLAELLRRMARRETPRTEANVQSDLHALLLSAPLSLREQDLEDREITLEQQAGSRRRIDVEAGLCVFEVKRDLRVGHVRADAEVQLAGYVVSRTQAMRQRYVGVLTDGAEWHLYQLSGVTLRHVSAFTVSADKPDVEGLTVWLEAVLSTGKEIAPTPPEIERRLGAHSPAHALDFTELSEIYAAHRDLPTVKLKRELWARLLTTAFGTGFADNDALFVEHTLLVAMAEIIAHAVIGLDPTAPQISAEAVVTGQMFANAEVYGVVEADFFDWLVEVPGGDRFVKALARRVARFAWRDVEHDVLKVLYESVISAAQRKKLGEYYTPDWLADRIVDAAVTDPLKQRVLDPSCGSGTFLFHAIRRYLAAATKKKLSNAEALKGVVSQVIGMDIHPVAVTFARVTYLLAIGPDRLQSEDRPPLSVPVYLGDSIQWGQERTLFTKSEALVVPTDGRQLIAHGLKFPKRTLTDAGQFDRLVSTLTDMASVKRKPGGPVPALSTVFRRFAIEQPDEAMLTETFKTLCELHDAGRDHIWGYYVRNLARPVWLTRPENRVDVLVGNPPWLSYRFMTPEMQKEFRRLSKERGLWAGAAVATQQDLSALFVLRCVERYLKNGGTFGFVMPWSVLRGRQFAGFRTGYYEQQALSVAFSLSWDVHGVKPTFFPVPAAVIHGRRAAERTALPSAVEAWAGKLPQSNVSWNVASRIITRRAGSVKEAKSVERGDRSPYHTRFANGATVFPRFLFVVEPRAAGPLGAGAGRVSIISRRTPNEKAPWKTLPPLEGIVERQFVRPMHLGETILPFRPLKPLRALVPWDGKRLLDSTDERLAQYTGLALWWARAEAIWNEHRSSDRLTLRDQLDYRKKLTEQFPTPPYRLVYNKSGMYLAAAIVTDTAIIDHKLYWGTCNTLAEARYLEAVLNSDELTKRIRPLQSRGEHNPRDYDKYVWQVPIPIFDEENKRHQRLAKLAEEAEKIAETVDVSDGRRFEALRRTVRETIASSDVGRKVEVEVRELLEH
jgi:SAM-dependent methyltransferase